MSWICTHPALDKKMSLPNTIGCPIFANREVATVLALPIAQSQAAWLIAFDASYIGIAHVSIKLDGLLPTREDTNGGAEASLCYGGRPWHPIRVLSGQWNAGGVRCRTAQMERSTSDFWKSTLTNPAASITDCALFSLTRNSDADVG